MEAWFKDSGKFKFMDLVGEVNMRDAISLEQRLKELIGGGNRYLVINLSDTEFLNSYMITLFITLYKRLVSMGGNLFLIIGDSNVREVIRVSGIETVIKSYRTEKEFLKANPLE